MTRQVLIPIRAWDSIPRSLSARISTSHAAPRPPIPRTVDCSLPGIPTLASGFPANSLTDPEPPPLFFSLDPHLVTPYMQQWHLSTQYELPSNTVFEVTYAGSRGLKQYIYLNGNQAAPNPDPNLPFADRRPLPQLDGFVGWFRSAGQSNYDSLQARAEKRFSHGLTFLASYTWAHALDIASNADLGAQNGGDFRYFKDPQAEYGNSDFDIRNRFVFSYLYELPIGHGKRPDGRCQRSDSTRSLAVGRWAALRRYLRQLVHHSGRQWRGQLRRPAAARLDRRSRTRRRACPAHSLIPAPSPIRHKVHSETSAATAFRGRAIRYGTSRCSRTSLSPSAPNWNSGPSSLTCSTIPNLQFAKSGPQNSINTTTFGTPQFGFLTAARDPRQIQLALKLSF